MNRALSSQCRAGRRRGFTLVEIALCIGIIGFALVAIIGVLPAGLRVQQENREDTLINQDAQYLLEAIRSGATGGAANVLTNFVDAVDSGGVHHVSAISGGPSTYATGREIIGYLSAPGINAANIRNISGTASDLSPSQVATNFAFRYLVYVTVTPVLRQVTLPTTPPTNVSVIAHHDLTFDFRWPILPGPPTVTNTGSGRKLFRTAVAGTLTNYTSPNLWFFEPQVFYR